MSDTKAAFNKESKRAKENTITLMGIFMKGFGLMAKSTAEESTSIAREMGNLLKDLTMATSSTITSTALGIYETETEF